jgi:hemerythrin
MLQLRLLNKYLLIRNSKIFLGGFIMFEWKNSFSCKIKDIDEQHIKLFEIGARLYDIVSLNDETDHYDEITSILEELADYTEYHFSFEEKMMEKEGYADFELHKIEHDFFIKKIKKLEKSDIDENQKDAMLKMVAFVADWISSHILITDVQYITFFNEKGIV